MKLNTLILAALCVSPLYLAASDNNHINNDYRVVLYNENEISKWDINKAITTYNLQEIDELCQKAKQSIINAPIEFMLSNNHGNSITINMPLLSKAITKDAQNNSNLATSLMLQNGADPNQFITTTQQGYTKTMLPLQMVLNKLMADQESPYKTILETLIKYHADPRIKDSQGQSALCSIYNFLHEIDTSKSEAHNQKNAPKENNPNAISPINTTDRKIRNGIDTLGILVNNVDARHVRFHPQPSMLPRSIQHILKTEPWNNANHACSWLTKNEKTQKHKENMWEYRNNDQYTDCCIAIDDKKN